MMDVALKLILMLLLMCTIWSYKVELNEELVERLAELKKASGGEGGEMSMEEEHWMMKEILMEMTEDPTVAETMMEMEMGAEGEGGDPAMMEVDPNIERPQPSCSSIHGCNECIENNCAWCLSSRSCKPDEAWQCQGMEDHVGYAGIGTHTTCPTEEELKLKREERKRRKVEAQQKVEEERLKNKKRDTTPQAPEEGEDEGNVDKVEHYNELLRRAKLAEEGYGPRYPYETLNVDVTSSSSDIRKAYRKLSVAFHPDKNPGDAEATRLFDARLARLRDKRHRAGRV